MIKKKAAKKTGAKAAGPASKGAAPVRKRSAKPSTGRRQQPKVFVVGIGASAGGLEPLQTFFRHARVDADLAYIVVSHLDPAHPSALVQLLQRETTMPVVEIEDGMRVGPNRVFVIPPNRFVAIKRGVLRLSRPNTKRGVRLPIDFMFRSLAEDQGDHAISVVLSGTGTDGTLGLRAVKGAGGLTLAQDEATAHYDSMPRSAVSTGAVDFVLPVDRMPEQLLRFIQHPYATGTAFTAPEPQLNDHLDRIFAQLRRHTGHDFANYKRNTVLRRIERRMAVHQIAELADYARFLDQNRDEVVALFKELLIGVTSFFRDPDAFAALQAKVLPQIFAQKQPGDSLRVWVAGCSTGEEAYSLAILLAEELERAALSLKVQIFATDLDEDALEFARAALYPESIAADVSAERLAKFFTAEGQGFRIKKSIRETLVVAKQDLIHDAPFSKLDLISCRNLLIYMNQVLQRKIIPLFHYTLNPGGYLLLGPAEGVGEFTRLFALVDKKWKIYQGRNVPRQPAGFPAPLRVATAERAAGGKPAQENRLAEATNRLLLNQYAPPCVIINEQYEIVHFHGRTSQYLEPPTGAPSVSVLKMARDWLRIDLRSAIHKAFKQNETVINPALRHDEGGRMRLLNLIVRPLLEPPELRGHMMVIFNDISELAGMVRPQPAADAHYDQRVLDLESELNSTKESLQTTIELLETSNEELKSSNEELQSTNEELQSTNEELETSKEELQSINEELITVNSELQSKLDELSQANDDMINLLSSTQIGTVFLDNELRIKRFTPAIAKVMNLIPSDIGRPVEHISSNLVDENLTADVEEVLRTLVYKEKELQTKGGDWYIMRILPYRTKENVIEGAVVSFIDISARQLAQVRANATMGYAEALLASLKEPALVLNSRLKVLAANPAYYAQFDARVDATEGQDIFSLKGSAWETAEIHALLDHTLPRDGAIDNVALHLRGALSNRTLQLRARILKLRAPIVAGEDELVLLLLYGAEAH